MAISEQDVRHIARLANLALGDDAITRMAGELSAIVGWVEQLAAVDTAGVEPIAQVTGLVDVTRPDEPRGMLPTATVLANAPRADGASFLVPKAVER